MNSKVLYSLIAALCVIIVLLLGYIFSPHMRLLFSSSQYETGEQTDSLAPFPGYSEMMDEHCKSMPEMRGCEPYNLLEQRRQNATKESSGNAESFLNSDPKTLDGAKTSQIISLKDGDEYTLEVTQVAKEIGNDTVAMLAYNGSIPGPTITAPAGAKITLHFVNKVQ